MEARDELSVILSWLEDFRPMNPKRIDHIKEYTQKLFNEWGQLGGKTMRLEQEIEELKEELQALEG